jgi:hypothetical protein
LSGCSTGPSFNRVPSAPFALRETRLYHVFHTIVNSQARASSSRSDERKRIARTQASWTTSSAFRVVPGEPARVVECRIKVRQNGFLERSRTHRLAI